MIEGFQLVPFQEPGYKQLVAQKRHLLLLEPGLGKTVVSTKALYDTNCRTVLIICPKNAIKVWENHIRRWFDGLDGVAGKTSEETETSFCIWRWRRKYNNAEKRKALWRSRHPEAKVNIYITTYAGFIQDQADFIHRYDHIIVDEAKRLRNRKSKAFVALKPLAKEATYLWLLTGTPGYQPKHFWTMFHLLDPKLFGSYWRFVGAFYVMIKNEFGQQEIVAFKNQKGWFDLLRRKATILTKADVGHQETIRAVKYAELDVDQERLYKQYEEDMLVVIGDRLDLVSTSLGQTLRYRQLLICPKIIDPALSVGGAIVDLVETFQEEEASPQCVIFCPFTDAFPHFTKYLEEQGYPGVQVLQGGLDPDEQERRINVWRQSRVPILCSIKYAEAFSLEPAKEAYFIGREWDPDENKQAEERLNRLTTKHAVTAYYYTYEDTYDERQLEILNTKQRQKNMTLQAKR